ncbi:hypothetical protein IT403_03335 [Candidatus Nomurabacteria bacterium]|nr:hypothetical protein [Candidatus Nomurabacteria bacterium]
MEKVRKPLSIVVGIILGCIGLFFLFIVFVFPPFVLFGLPIGIFLLYLSYNSLKKDFQKNIIDHVDIDGNNQLVKDTNKHKKSNPVMIIFILILVIIVLRLISFFFFTDLSSMRAGM